ncbi:MAG TPA: alpha/beta hydrolase [Balneolaceae bacterium]|nr:alpha/beta hydrolase [Balneolaceae bacterium]
MTPEKKTSLLNNTKTAWYKTGSGKPLIILHGWGSSSRVMFPVAAQLSSLRTCYLLDFPGFGDSPEPSRPFSIDDYADLVENFITEQELESVDFLVHSFGGRVILKLLTRDHIKEYIDKILITGGAGMKPKRNPSYYFKKYLAKSLKAPFAVLPENLRGKGLEKLRSTSLWQKLGSSDYQKLSGVMRETFVKSVSEHLDELLPEIDHDILLLWGTEDDATPLYQAERMNRGLKNSALVTIENAGHYAFLNKPKRFSAIAEAFFKG